MTLSTRSRRFGFRTALFAAFLVVVGSQLVLAPASAVAAEEPPPTVDWRMLRGLNYRTGEASPALKKVAGTVVRVPGFMVPLDDDAEDVNEFLLVPYVGACVHAPPPPPNQIVIVKMDSNRKVKVDWYDPIWVYGKIEISTTKSPYTDVAFKIGGQKIEPYKD